MGPTPAWVGCLPSFLDSSPVLVHLASSFKSGEFGHLWGHHVAFPFPEHPSLHRHWIRGRIRVFSPHPTLPGRNDLLLPVDKRTEALRVCVVSLRSHSNFGEGNRPGFTLWSKLVCSAVGQQSDWLQEGKYFITTGKIYRQ